MPNAKGLDAAERLTFHIMGAAVSDAAAEFNAFTRSLSEQSGIKVVPCGENEVQLSTKRGGENAILALMRFEGVLADDGENAVLTMSLSLPRRALELFQRLRIFLFGSKRPYRLFSDARNCLVPLDSNLYCLDFPPQDQQLAQAMRAGGLEPIYYYQPTGTFFALAADETVRIVNTPFLDLLYKGEKAAVVSEELSYEVAANIQSFGVLYTRGLIPVNFYEYYCKPRKIMNYSFLDVQPARRALLLRPFIYELHALHAPHLQIGDDAEDNPYTLPLHEGEHLDDVIRRLLRNDLRICSDYVGAYISRAIEFHAAAPCLAVSIFVEHFDRALPREGAARSANKRRRRRRRHRSHSAEPASS